MSRVSGTLAFSAGGDGGRRSPEHSSRKPRTGFAKGPVPPGWRAEREPFAKTRTPPEQEKGGVLGNPHWHLPGEPEGSGELSRRIGLHSPDSSGNKVTIEHRRAFGATSR
jgi:hypothetical protein